MAKTKCFIRFSNDKDKFKQSSCLFTISVGQQTHENEHFESTINLINQSFQSATMLVDDSLQRYTMALSRIQGPDDFHDIAIQEGNLWLKRNKKYYSKLTNLNKIIRWDTWLNHPNFDAQRTAILNEIDIDPEYKLDFDASINAFIEKYRKRLDNKNQFNEKRAKQLCFDFILEECTALCLWMELNCNYEVYPNLHNRAINKTRSKFVLSSNPELLQTVTLGFRNAKQLNPQRFICLEQSSLQMVSKTMEEQHVAEQGSH